MTRLLAKLEFRLGSILSWINNKFNLITIKKLLIFGHSLAVRAKNTYQLEKGCLKMSPLYFGILPKWVHLFRKVPSYKRKQVHSVSRLPPIYINTPPPFYTISNKVYLPINILKKRVSANKHFVKKEYLRISTSAK